MDKKLCLSDIASQSDRYLLDCYKVFQALGHLEALDVQVPGMEEIVHPLLALMVGFCLSDFIVVVWKLEVDTATVNVNVTPNDIRGHDTAHTSRGRSELGKLGSTRVEKHSTPPKVSPS